MTSTSTVFSPRSREDLQRSVDEYAELVTMNTVVNCSYGPFDEWDISCVTKIWDTFVATRLFNDDISKWDVSNVEDMSVLGSTIFND